MFTKRVGGYATVAHRHTVSAGQQVLYHQPPHELGASKDQHVQVHCRAAHLSCSTSSMTWVAGTGSFHLVYADGR